MSIPLLSIIIPAHNEENRLPRSLEQVFAFLERQSYEAEVLVIENGSSDRTLEIARSYLDKRENLHVLREEGRGKGLAVRRGMLEARGEYRFMCDADLSMPIEEVNKFLPPSLSGFDVAIGSREVRGAVRYHEPFYRHFGGRFINYIIRLFILPDLQDTQCGFKCFRAEVADDLFLGQGLLFDQRRDTLGGHGGGPPAHGGAGPRGELQPGASFWCCPFRAPPWRRPQVAFLSVIARANRKHSMALTSGAMRVPPMAGPAAVLSMTTIARSPTEGVRR